MFTYRDDGDLELGPKDGKGNFNCRCDCCIYWRRHSHRLAANRERVTNRVKDVLEWTKGKLWNAQVGVEKQKLKRQDSDREARLLRAERAGLWAEVRELKKRLAKFSWNTWMISRIKKLAGWD